MKSKTLKIVVDVILSVIFLIIASILVNWLSGLIFGFDDRGNANVNGGILLTITVLLTLGFAFWFYKYVHLGSRKINK